MITAFRNSEIISTKLGKKTPFYEKLTRSQAVLTACDSISGALALRDDAISNESSVANIIRRLVWPLQVLDLLVNNNE